MIDSTKDEKKAITKPITEPEITDVNLGFVEKKKFRINGDNDRVLELNVSDMNIASRLSEVYPKLLAFVDDVKNQTNKALADTGDDSEQLAEMAKFLTDIDAKMRELIDYVFDSNVSEVCAPTGNMFDPVNGEYRYEHIINVVANLYTNGLNKELDAIKKKAAKHTSKYTKKYHK